MESLLQYTFSISTTKIIDNLHPGDVALAQSERALVLLLYYWVILNVNMSNGLNYNEDSSRND